MNSWGACRRRQVILGTLWLGVPTKKGYEPRITQCYFDGDDRNATDPYVKKELIIKPVSGSAKNAMVHGVFDLTLDREQPAEAGAAASYPDYAGEYEIAPGVVVTVRADGGTLLWHLSTPEDPGDPVDGILISHSRTRFFVAEYDLGVEFVRDEHGAVTHMLDSHGQLNKKLR